MLRFGRDDVRSGVHEKGRLLVESLPFILLLF
jgi:hypothetical protein